MKRENSEIIKDIPREILLDLYRVMLRIRLVELKIEELYSQDEMKTPVHLCVGQEAIAAGVCANLKKDDFCFSNHRCHGHYLAKGGDLKAMIAELYCKETGCSKGRGGSMHLVDTAAGFCGTSSIIAGSIPIATGAGLSAILQKTGKVSVVFFGDAGVEQGVFYESVSFAVLKKLPVIYVCENNLYSVCTPLKERQPDDKIYRRAEGFSIPSYEVDGNDVIEVYNVARGAVESAKNGEGPSFIECKTYRTRDHAGAGSGINLGYRTQEELDQWALKCPARNYENLLLESGLLNKDSVENIKSSIEREIKEAFEFAQKSPLPNVNDISKHLYE
ncbi:MAG: thiamine pyrophosphate-dependent dehydrogenase E1 component subunit alpha [Candidatus Omnitrophota bacterium]